RRKGFDLAIKSFSNLSARNAKFLLVGEGPERKNYISTLKDLGLEDRVIVFDKSDEVELFYCAADVFLMTSYNEPFGQTILEAMASSLAIIAFESDPKLGVYTASSEILDSRAGAILCEPNEESLATSMETITI